MDIGHTILQGVKDRAHRISDEKFWNIVFLLKSACFILVLAFLIVLWDTAPSFPPIVDIKTDIHVDNRADGKFLRIFESYNVVRPVQFTQTYSLVGPKTLRIHSVRGSYTLGLKTEIIFVPYDELTHGRWCLQSTVSWINGLSLRSHNMSLPENCFEVKG